MNKRDKNNEENSINKVLNNAIEKVVEDLMLTLAFKNNLLGTKFLKDAIAYNCIQKLTGVSCEQDVYCYVSNKYDTTNERVYKAIRHCVDVCYRQGQLKALNKIFHYPLVSNVFVPTNGEIIATLSLLVQRLVSIDENGNVKFSRITFNGYTQE